MSDSPLLYQVLADAVLLLHVAVVLFVVGGLLLIVVGGARRWDWVRNPGFRWLHLGAIAFVVAESWFGVACPLTTLESSLRSLAGQAAYDGDFVAHWLRRLLFFAAPPWVFVTGYSAFGLLVILAWKRFPPRSLFRRPHRFHWW